MIAASCCPDKKHHAKGLCKNCYYRQRRATYPSYRHNEWRKRGLKIYGLSLSNYSALLKEQGCVCAICFSPGRAGRRFNVDHCHETGKVRGLLCDKCNQGLGMFKDDALVLNFAINYLVRGQTPGEYVQS